MSKETPKKQTYEELTKDLDKKYQDKAKPNIFKAVLIPFRAIRDAFRFVADVIRFRLLIPKEERMNFVSIAEESKPEKPDKTPTARENDLKEQILKDRGLKRNEKIEKLCALCYKSNKELVIPLSFLEREASGSSPEKAPDAILVFEKRGESVQIGFAPKEYKTKNAQPTYNLSITGGINYNDRGKPIFESIDKVSSLLFKKYKINKELLNITKDSLLTESSERLTTDISEMEKSGEEKAESVREAPTMASQNPPMVDYGLTQEEYTKKVQFMETAAIDTKGFLEKMCDLTMESGKIISVPLTPLNEQAHPMAGDPALLPAVALTFEKGPDGIHMYLDHLNTQDNQYQYIHESIGDILYNEEMEMTQKRLFKALHTLLEYKCDKDIVITQEFFVPQRVIPLVSKEQPIQESSILNDMNVDLSDYADRFSKIPEEEFVEVSQSSSLFQEIISQNNVSNNAQMQPDIPLQDRSLEELEER